MSGTRAWALVALGVIGVAAAADLWSVERANRLYRRGEPRAAREAFQARVDGAAARAPLERHNLGVALLDLGEVEPALAELRRAVGAGTGTVRAQASYNLGVAALARAGAGGGADTVRAYASEAVEGNRTALRHDPAWEDARWNLALALRMLDSLDAVAPQRDGEVGGASADLDAVVRAESISEGEEDEVGPEAPTEGEDEAFAGRDATLGMSLADALAILGDAHLEADVIVGKLLGLAGRNRFGRRRGDPRARW